MLAWGIASHDTSLGVHSVISDGTRHNIVETPTIAYFLVSSERIKELVGVFYFIYLLQVYTHRLIILSQLGATEKLAF
jgi:hypothetical protein